MTRTRATFTLTFALLTASTLGVATAAQSPTPAPTPVPTDACAGAEPGSGMMGDPGASMGTGMMGDPGDASMGGGMMGGSPAPVASPAAEASAVAGAVRIAMTLLDTMRITPCAITVSAGVPITFVVTNAGAIDHEFFLGDAAEQADHDQEMMTMGGAAMHEGEPGMIVHAGTTEEITYTFEASGQFEAACHVPGHYPAGMKAIVTVVP